MYYNIYNDIIIYIMTFIMYYNIYNDIYYVL